MRQELRDGLFERRAIHPVRDDDDVLIGELADALAAAAAGRYRGFAGAGGVDAADALAAAGQHGGDGRGLGAVADRIGGVLDVAADIDFAVVGQDGGADLEVAVGRVGLGADGLGGGEQLGVTVPVQAIQALPYVLTVVLLAGFIGKAVGPKAGGVAYTKER